MDATTTINDYLENPEIDFDSLSDLISMAQKREIYGKRICKL